MKKRLLHELFELQVKRRPHAVAVKSLATEITYQQLWSLSQKLRAVLLELNTQPNHPVAVVLGKGPNQVQAVLGVLSAGSPYLPIDPEESIERLHYLFKTANIKILITENNYKSSIIWPDHIFIVNIDELKELVATFPKSVISEDDLAYILFTSGSTGTPKGVMVRHKNVINTILDVNKRFSVSEKDKVFALSGLTFDLSAYDIFGVLAAGGTIIMPNIDQAKDPTQWLEFFFNEDVSIWNSAPALMHIFIQFINHKKLDMIRCKLRLVLLSGDWIPLDLPDKIRALFNKAQIISLGGATEASIWSIFYEITDIDPRWKSIPYGKPLRNQEFYILNDDLSPVCNDEEGELFIGGKGVAAGYWHDHQRTKEQFILHPKYGLIYKTGDLGRYLSDGSIELIGRKDDQVKVSGCRIGINAIEKELLKFPGIKQALVLSSGGKGRQSLIAYFNFDYDEKIKNKKQASILKKEKTYCWNKVYEELYRKDDFSFNKDPTFNIAGWMSSYSNNQFISNIEMKEWVENTIKRISFLNINDASILEIGCGTGLMLFRLAEKVKKYTATDFSRNSINYIKDQLPLLGMQNVKLIECEATDIGKIKENYDLVLINSVIQYFPSEDYLSDVLNKCIDKIQSPGYVFIGDIRSLHLLSEFHASVLLERNIKNFSYPGSKFILQESIFNEKELIIHFDFFYAYKEKNPKVSGVEILLKEGVFKNEMNCYRYDVILYVNFPKVHLDKEILSYSWNDSERNCRQVKDFYSILSRVHPDFLFIRDIPNQRTAIISRFLKNSIQGYSKKWCDYNESLDGLKKSLVDPNLFFRLADSLGYYVSVSWGLKNPSEYFDVFFINKNNIHNIHKVFCDPNRNCISRLKDKVYTNFPLHHHINQALISDIKLFLKNRLSRYMVPDRFIPISSLPVTKNGKIDRKTLLIISQSLFEKDYIAPKTDIQRKLVSIWKEVLEIQHVGIQDNFCELGGTSLLAMQLIIRVSQVFQVEISIRELTSSIVNIENLGLLIHKKLGATKSISVVSIRSKVHRFFPSSCRDAEVTHVKVRKIASH